MNLFLFAHQDDEYGVFPVLERLVADGELVTVAYLTSGTPDGGPSMLRNAESRDVLTRMGLEASRIHFLGGEYGIPDGSLYAHLDTAVAALHETVDHATPPQRVFCPAWEGGHQDHDACYIVGCYLAQQLGCLENSRQFPLYHGRGLPGILWHTFSPLPENGEVESTDISWEQRLRYLRFCLHYRSQWRTWLGLYPMYALHLFTVGKQYLQPLRTSRLAQAPHEGRCLYERRGFCDPGQFRYHSRALVDKISN